MISGPKTGSATQMARRRFAARGVAILAGLGIAGGGATRAWQWHREAPARRLYGRGEAFYKAGQTEAALDAWQTATETVPTWPEPYYRIAEVLQAFGEREAAVQVLLRVQDANPRAPHLLCRQAEAYLLTEAPVQARDLSARAVAREPNCARAHVTFALARREEVDTAVMHLRRAHQLAPGDRDTLLDLARVQAQGGRMEEAKETLARLQTLMPADAEVHYLLGVALSARPSDQAAIRQAEGHLRQALKLEPERWDARAQLGILYLQQRQWKRARPFLEEARRRNPYSGPTLYRLATVRRQLGDQSADALWAELRELEANTARWKEWQKQLAQRPDDLTLMLDTAELSLRVGAAQAASRLARAALRREPTNNRARRVLEQLQHTAAPSSVHD